MIPAVNLLRNYLFADKSYERSSPTVNAWSESYCSPIHRKIVLQWRSWKRNERTLLHLGCSIKVFTTVCLLSHICLHQRKLPRPNGVLFIARITSHFEAKHLMSLFYVSIEIPVSIVRMYLTLRASFESLCNSGRFCLKSTNMRYQ